MTKFGPLGNSEDCAGVSGLDDKLMTHLLLDAGIVDVVVVAVVVMVVGHLVVVVFVVSLLFLLLFCARTTLVVSLSMGSDGGIYCYLGDYDGIHFSE